MGEGKEEKAAGILTSIMDVNGISQAILTLARNEKMRKQMGEIGYERVKESYQLPMLKQTYEKLYGRWNRGDTTWQE